MKFHVVTLGCDKNTVDSERYVAELVHQGAVLSTDAAGADLIVVNTCGFIDAAKRESIEAIVEAARHKETGSCRMVAAVGCMVERHKQELRDALPEVDLLLGSSETDQLIAEVDARGLLPDAPELAHPGVRLYTGSMPHVRYLKISEGCDHGCAFCAIPLMRGKHRSFATSDIAREAQLLELQGAREVNLVAQDLAHYGRDSRDGTSLPTLLKELLNETGIPLFRLLYIYSAGLTDAMLDLIATEPRIVRYLDIPMQHANDAVLARMRRPERRTKQLTKLNHIRTSIPGIAIRSTVIVGFPGETDAEFNDLIEFLNEAQLDRLGVFTYSAQDGTRAAAFEDDVPEEVKRERMERVQEVQRLITADRYAALVGTTARAIVDRQGEGGAPSELRIDAQADDIDGLTWCHTSLPPGSIVSVAITDVAEDYDFIATVERELSAPVLASGRRSRQLPLVSSTVGSFGR